MVDGLFNGPRNAVVDSAGIVYVADTGNGRIQKFKLAIPLTAAFTPSVTSGQAPLDGGVHGCLDRFAHGLVVGLRD